MAFTKAQVVLPATTGLPSDVFINTFHFVTAVNNSIIGAEIALRLATFYNTNTVSTGNSVDDYLGNIIDRGVGAALVKLYDEADNNLPPYYEDSFTLGAAIAATDLPWEVAMCLSFKNTSTTSYPERNRRGRIYLGPLTTSAQTESGGSVRPSSAFGDTALASAARLHDADDADAGWVVWSKTLGLSFPVEVGWWDNAFDTQRRRGEAATARTTTTF